MMMTRAEYYGAVQFGFLYSPVNVLPGLCRKLVTLNAVLLTVELFCRKKSYLVFR